jgi:cysteinyl-tRNA synthetase
MLSCVVKFVPSPLFQREKTFASLLQRGADSKNGEDGEDEEDEEDEKDYLLWKFLEKGERGYETSWILWYGIGNGYRPGDEQRVGRL